MKTIILILTIFSASTSLAGNLNDYSHDFDHSLISYKFRDQVSFGLKQYTLDYEKSSEKVLTSSVGISRKVVPTESDFGAGIGLDLDFGQNQEIKMLKAGLYIEMGYSFYLQKDLVLGLNGLVGLDYMSYENQKLSWSQLNKVDGAVLSYGASLDLVKNFSQNKQFGLKTTYQRYKVNIQSESEISSASLIFVLNLGF